jgi:hypothetical protein
VGAKFKASVRSNLDFYKSRGKAMASVEPGGLAREGQVPRWQIGLVINYSMPKYTNICLNAQFVESQFSPNVHYLSVDDLDPKPDPKQRKFRIWMIQKKVPLFIKVFICNSAKSNVANPDPVPFWPLDPWSGIPFFRIPNLYFWKLNDKFFGKKF